MYYTTSGVLQGCPLSRLFFSICIDLFVHAFQRLPLGSTSSEASIGFIPHALLCEMLGTESKLQRIALRSSDQCKCNLAIERFQAEVVVSEASFPVDSCGFLWIPMFVYGCIIIRCL